jgi:hypothetical protein
MVPPSGQYVCRNDSRSCNLVLLSIDIRDSVAMNLAAFSTSAKRRPTGSHLDCMRGPCAGSAMRKKTILYTYVRADCLEGSSGARQDGHIVSSTLQSLPCTNALFVTDTITWQASGDGNLMPLQRLARSASESSAQTQRAGAFLIRCVGRDGEYE